MSDQLPTPRPTPPSILEVSDPILRQRAIDIYRVASLLLDLIDRQRACFHELRAHRCAYPAALIPQGQAIAACVASLANFGCFPSAVEALKWFPESPSCEIARKGLTEEEVNEIESHLRIKVQERDKQDIPN